MRTAPPPPISLTSPSPGRMYLRKKQETYGGGSGAWPGWADA